MKLRKLELQDKSEFISYIKEIRNSNERIIPSPFGVLENYEELLQAINIDMLSADNKFFRVPSDHYGLFSYSEDSSNKAVNNSGELVGLVGLRHYLNDNLRIRGGHIGYSIRPSCRGRGFGKLILQLSLPYLKSLGLSSVLVTTDPWNTLSQKVIIANGGEFTKAVKADNQYYFHYQLPTRQPISL